MKKLIYALFFSICMFMLHPSIAGKDQPYRFPYGDVIINDPLKARAVLILFEADRNAPKPLFADPNAFEMHEKTLTMEQVVAAELLGKKGNSLVHRWNRGEFNDHEGLELGTLYLFQAAQMGFPKARSWVKIIYSTLSKYYETMDPNPELSQLYERQRFKLASSSLSYLDIRWDIAERQFYALPQETRDQLRDRVIKPGISLISHQSQYHAKVPAGRMTSIEGPKIIHNRTPNEDDSATEDSTCLTLPPPRTRSLSETFGSFLTYAASRLICAGSPHTKTD
jgi:hypothetical protein